MSTVLNLCATKTVARTVVGALIYFYFIFKNIFKSYDDLHEFPTSVGYRTVIRISSSIPSGSSHYTVPSCGKSFSLKQHISLEFALKNYKDLPIQSNYITECQNGTRQIQSHIFICLCSSKSVIIVNHVTVLNTVTRLFSYKANDNVA